MILPNQKFIFEKEIDITELSNFSNHRRLSLFLSKGTTCKECGANGSRLIYGRRRQELHLDLYDENLSVMMTCAHIIPACLGGQFHPDNLRPLCHICNMNEGFDGKHLVKHRYLFDDIVKGSDVVRKNGDVFQNGNKLATITDIFKSNKDKKIYLVFDGGFTYPFSKVKFLKHKMIDY